MYWISGALVFAVMALLVLWVGWKRMHRRPCPGCGLSVDQSESRCPYCGHALTR